MGALPGLRLACGNDQKQDAQVSNVRHRNRGDNDDDNDKEADYNDGTDLMAIFLLPPPLSPLPSWDCCSRSCIPLPTTTRTILVSNSNAGGNGNNDG